MFVNDAVVNGVVLKVAFVRLLENAISVDGMTPDGQRFTVELPLSDGMILSVAPGVENTPAAPVKKERKARKVKSSDPAMEPVLCAPAVESVEVVDDATYLTLTQNRGRGRPSKDVSAKIAAYKAAHGIE